jgi:flagellar hook-associated protein 3 FlgL
MRVNEQQVVNDLLYSLGQDRQSIDQLQEQISSGKVVNSPSDDPTLNQRLMLLQDQVNQNTTYTDNAQYAEGFLTMQESSLGSAVSTLTNIKTMMLSAANDSNPQDLQNYGTQLGQYITQLVDLSNSKYGSKYIFGGTQTTSQPFFMNSGGTSVSTNPNGIDGALKIDVGFQISEQYNVTGQEAFNGGQMFNDLIAIQTKLAAGTSPTASDLTTVDNYLNSMVSSNAKAGAMLNRMQLIQSQISSQTQSLQSTMSNLGDTDVASAVVKMQQQQTALNAALQTGAQLIKLSLVNFL